LADAIERELHLKPRLIEGRGGVFEVREGRKLIYSKRSTGRFPEHQEVLRLLGKD